jgi:hypothetical protein
MLGGEIEHIDAAEIAIGRVTDRLLDGGNATGISRLPQHAEKSFRIAHRSQSYAGRSAEAQEEGKSAVSSLQGAEPRARVVAASQQIDVCLEKSGKRL